VSRETCRDATTTNSRGKRKPVVRPPRPTHEANVNLGEWCGCTMDQLSMTSPRPPLPLLKTCSYVSTVLFCVTSLPYAPPVAPMRM
jgi:hypothetical protein